MKDKINELATKRRGILEASMYRNKLISDGLPTWK
jgi:hypothetical protein